MPYVRLAGERTIARPDAAALTREVVASRGRLLKPGGPRKADLVLVELESGPVVVKDYSGKSPWRRLLGRCQIAREHRAYRLAGTTDGLPRMIGCVDAHALALERVEGTLLWHHDSRFRDAERHLTRLSGLIRHLHARGVVHLDLRGKSNLLVRPGGDLVIVDLAAAVCFRPGGLLHRLLFRWFRLVDEIALIKWKARLAQDLVTEEEASRLARFRPWRRLWVFNRGHRKPAPASPGGSRALREPGS